MKFFNSHWDFSRVFNRTTIRFTLMVISIAAMALGGGADEHWEG